MPGSLSQPRTRYPPAACSDLVNEFISSVATAGSAPPQSYSQPVSLCRVGVESEREMSAVARAKQVYSMTTAALLHARRVSACVWDFVFSFFLPSNFLSPPKCQLCQEVCKADFEVGNPWTQKSPPPEEEKIGLHMTTEVQCSFLPPYCLSGYICFRALSLRCSFEIQGGNAATKKKKKKKKSTSHWFCSGNRAHNEANHSEAKTEIFASELIRQGIARPK